MNDAIERVRVKNQILSVIKMHGSQSAVDLAIKLQVSPMAIRQHTQIQTYSAQMQDSQDWQERVAILARLRTQEGYMAEAIEESPGVLLLAENHCSICAAAQSCSQLCSSELQVFKTLLGSDVTVERVEHILSGDRRCAYRISTCS